MKIAFLCIKRLLKYLEIVKNKLIKKSKDEFCNFKCFFKVILFYNHNIIKLFIILSETITKNILQAKYKPDF